MKKAQKEIISDLKNYRKVFEKNAKEDRKKYYLEEKSFYRDLRFNDFLENRSRMHLIERILGIEETKMEIVIYA